MVEQLVVSIAEGLDGKRIAVTGSTGFLGTALVERLLRSAPGCELVLLIRPGRRSDRDPAGQPGDLPQRRLRPPARARGDEFQATLDRRVTAVAGDVGTDGLGLDDAGRAALADCDIVIHSAATVSFDSPLDAAVEVNLLGPTRIAAALQRAGGHAPPRGRVHLLRRRQPPGRRPRGAGRGERLLHRRRLARRGRRRPPHAHRRRGRQPHAREAGRVPQAGPPGAGRRRRAPAGRQDRAAPDPLGHRPHGRGRPGPGRLAGLARRLRLHQGPRRAGPVRDPGRRPGQHRAARRSSSRPGPSPSRAGSGASAWPSRSSSPTPAAC